MNPVQKCKTALVTGASRGIGRAIARSLAARGVRLALHYHVNDHAAEQTRAQLDGEGHILCAADLTDAASAARLWRGVADAFGPVDILVNNAGLFVDEWNATWLHTLAANLMGPANLSLLAAQAMAARPSAADPWGRGRIVNISSRGAFRGEPDAPAYGASKAGLNSLSQSMAKALAPQGVYVYCLAPGFVETDMAAQLLEGPTGPGILAQHPLGRVSMPDEVAAAAAFCALDAPAAMTGCIIDVNGASYLRT
jgi:3-oxoacyl-[acyl-carrier protein] reductase